MANQQRIIPSNRNVNNLVRGIKRIIHDEVGMLSDSDLTDSAGTL